VPPAYAPTIKDCLIQMLRNAAVHGIEPPEVRRAHTKQEIGAVSVHFRKRRRLRAVSRTTARASPPRRSSPRVRRQLISEEDPAAWTRAPPWR